MIPPRTLAQLWDNFRKKLRRKYPACDWYWVIEYQNDNLHYHVLLKADNPVEFADVNKLWRDCLKRKGIPQPGQNTVRVADVYDLTGVADYNLKRHKRDPWQYRPPGGLYRNLAVGSHGFCPRKTGLTETSALDVTADCGNGARADE